MVVFPSLQWSQRSIRIVYNYCMKELNTKIVPVLMILFVLYSNFSNMTSWKHKGSTHSMIFLVFLSKASQHIVLVKTNCFKDVVNASSHIRQQTLRSILIRINWSLCIFFLSLSLPKKTPKVMNIKKHWKNPPKWNIHTQFCIQLIAVWLIRVKKYIPKIIQNKMLAIKLLWTSKFVLRFCGGHGLYINGWQRT